SLGESRLTSLYMFHHRLASSAYIGAQSRTAGCGVPPFNMSHKKRLYTWASTPSRALKSKPSDMRGAAVVFGVFSFRSRLGVIASNAVRSGVGANTSLRERLK